MIAPGGGEKGHKWLQIQLRLETEKF